MVAITPIPHTPTSLAHATFPIKEKFCTKVLTVVEFNSRRRIRPHRLTAKRKLWIRDIKWMCMGSKRNLLDQRTVLITQLWIWVAIWSHLASSNLLQTNTNLSMWAWTQTEVQSALASKMVLKEFIWTKSSRAIENATLEKNLTISTTRSCSYLLCRNPVTMVWTMARTQAPIEQAMPSRSALTRSPPLDMFTRACH